MLLWYWVKKQDGHAHNCNHLQEARPGAQQE